MASAKPDINAEANISVNTSATAAGDAIVASPFNVFLNALDKSVWVVLDQDSQASFDVMEFTNDPWDALPSS